MKVIEIKVTNAQLEWAAWAIDPMLDYIEEIKESGETPPYTEEDIPKVDRSTSSIIFPTGKSELGLEAVEDLIVRLNNGADCEQNHEGRWSKHISADRLVKLLEKAFPERYTEKGAGR